MAAVEADRVVVALEAKLADYQAKVSGAANTFDKSMSTIEQAATAAEAATRTSAAGMANAAKAAAAAQEQASDRSSRARRKEANDDIELSARQIAQRLRLQQQIRGTAAATESGSARAANATRNLGRQISDIGTGLAGGQSPFLILAQQAPQVADALADTEGKAATLARFFAGPWGAALLAAGSILGVFVGKLLDGGDAAKKQKDQLQRLTDALQEYQRTSGEAVSNDYVRIRLAEVLSQRIAQQTVKIRENIKASLEQARAADASLRFTQGGVAGQSGNPSVAALSGLLKQADKDVAEARRNANVASGNRIVADQDRNAKGADAVAASAAKVKDAQDRYAIALNNLSVGLRKGDISQGDFNRLSLAARRRMEAVVNAPALARQGAAADRKEAAEARAAEAARLKAVKDEDAFQTALNKETLELLGVRADLTADTRLADELQRQQIEQERRDRARDIGAEGPTGTKRFTGSQVTKLQDLNNQVADAKLDLVNRRESIRAAQEELSVRTADLDNQRAIAQADAGIAKTTQARRESALRLLDLEDQMQKAQLEALIASKDATDVQKDIARKRLDTLNQTRPERQAAVERANAGPVASFLQTIPDTASELNEAFENVAANGLKSLTDGITDAITGAKSLGDAFKNVANQIISDLIRIAVERAIIEPLANALFPGAGSVVSSLLPRASGGPVTAGRMYRVNEGASPGRVEGFVPQGSGKIIPLGRMDAAMGGGGTTIINQSFNLDARYGVTTPELLTHVNTVAANAAAQAGAASFKASQAAAPGRMQKYQMLGS